MPNTNAGANVHAFVFVDDLTGEWAPMVQPYDAALDGTANRAPAMQCFVLDGDEWVPMTQF